MSFILYHLCFRQFQKNFLSSFFWHFFLNWKTNGCCWNVVFVYFSPSDEQQHARRLSSPPCCEFLPRIVGVELTDGQKWNGMLLLFDSRMFLWSSSAFRKSLSLLVNLNMHTSKNEFGQQGVNRGCFGTFQSSTAGGRCLSGLLVLHKDKQPDVWRSLPSNTRCPSEH